ncbi:MAG: hypothetical protein R3E01_12980 [Pirellulaceae bacterium]|nr:hypothetical protein [Planctomycetales bacterium]
MMINSHVSDTAAIRIPLAAPCGAFIAVVICCVGCSQPPIGQHAYEYSVMLYNVCDRQADDQLEQAAELISTSKAKGDISQTEHHLLDEIIEVARKGEWERAKMRSRQLLSSQNRPRPR